MRPQQAETEREDEMELDYRIEKRDNKAYIYYSDIDFMEPRIVTTYWFIPIEVDLIPDNSTIVKLADVILLKTEWREIPFSIAHHPDFIEFTPIKPPRKTGYRWDWGRWIKK
jgi:hypothetical protein